MICGLSMCHKVCVMVRGQLLELVFSFPRCVAAGDQTQIARLMQKTPLLSEPSYCPINFFS